MRKIRKNVMMLFIVCIIFVSNIVSNAAEAEPEEQEYYLLYIMDADNNMVIEVGKREVILEQSDHNIDLYNLTLFPMETGVFHPFQMVDLETAELTREVREYLLYAGYARINDESIAEEYELEAQEHAKSNSLGGWNTEEGDELEEVLMEEAVRTQEEYIAKLDTYTERGGREAGRGTAGRRKAGGRATGRRHIGRGKTERREAGEEQPEEEKRKEEKHEEQSKKEQRDEEQQEKNIKVIISETWNWIKEHPIICIIVFLAVVGIIWGMWRARHRY